MTRRLAIDSAGRFEAPQVISCCFRNARSVTPSAAHAAGLKTSSSKALTTNGCNLPRPRPISFLVRSTHHYGPFGSSSPKLPSTQTMGSIMMSRHTGRFPPAAVADTESFYLPLHRIH